jgi:hypothetical protein
MLKYAVANGIHKCLSQAVISVVRDLTEEVKNLYGAKRGIGRNKLTEQIQNHIARLCWLGELCVL